MLPDSWFHHTPWRVLLYDSIQNIPRFFFKYRSNADSAPNLNSAGYELYVTDLLSLYHEACASDAIARMLEVRHPPASPPLA